MVELPGLARWLVRAAAGARAAPAILGDLTELFDDRLRGRRATVADRLWLWRQVASCLHPRASGALRGSFQWSLPEHRRFPIRPLDPPTSRGLMLLSDLRFAFRTIRRTPLFTAMVALTMAIGIAATTVVTSALDGLVLRPFPFPEPDRLVGIGSSFPKLGGEVAFWENMSPAEYLDAKETPSLERVIAWDMGNRQVTVGENTENLFSGFWWGDPFPTLGMAPFLGRGFRPDEIANGHRVAVLSHRVWRNRFGGDSALVGGRILVNGEPYTVIGIMAPRVLLYGMDLWIPMEVDPAVFPRGRRQFQVIGRLAEGRTLAGANSELEVIARRVEQAHGQGLPEYAGWRMEARTWNDINVRTLKPVALVLVGAVGFVMLLVSTNVATLLLGRSQGRLREIALRSALGAGAGRILRQLLTESVLLALLGAALGVVLGAVGVAALDRFVERLGLPIAGGVAMNGRVLLVAIGVAVAAGIGFGIVPALQARRVDPQTALQASAGSATSTASRLRLQRLLVGVEAALAITLLAGGGYLIRSFLALNAVEPGFAPERLLTMRLSLARERYPAERVQPFFATLREQVAALPGVETVTTASQFPPTTFLRGPFKIEGQALEADGARPVAYQTLASSEYLETMKIPIRRGRFFTDRDRLDTPRIVVINEALATRYFAGTDPIGRRIQLNDGSAPWLEIVGVVGSTRNRGLDQEPAPELFIPALQGTGFENQLFLIVRTAGEPRAALPSVRSVVRSLDADQPVYSIRTVDEAFAGSQIRRRFSALLLGGFAAFALALAVVGIYGVVTYAAAQRTREVGVRMALGASASKVASLFVRQAILPVGIGAAAGLVAATALGGVLRGLLFGVASGDPLTLFGAAALLLGAALLAAWLPARRATRLDPVRALRIES